MRRAVHDETELPEQEDPQHTVACELNGWWNAAAVIIVKRGKTGKVVRADRASQTLQITRGGHEDQGGGGQG
jgi:tRNA1(Val) A37 N6-methylase TrmN6